MNLSKCNAKLETEDWILPDSKPPTTDNFACKKISQSYLSSFTYRTLSTGAKTSRDSPMTRSFFTKKYPLSTNEFYKLNYNCFWFQNKP